MYDDGYEWTYITLYLELTNNSSIHRYGGNIQSPQEFHPTTKSFDMERLTREGQMKLFVYSSLNDAL